MSGMSVRWLCYRILSAGPLAGCSSNSPPSTAAEGRVAMDGPKRSPHAGRSRVATSPLAFALLEIGLEVKDM